MLDRKVCMKIQYRAALEVVAGTVFVFGAAVLASLGLDVLLEAYGYKGVMTLLAIVVVGAFMNMIYQIRVSQLKYAEKLKQAVDQ